MKRFRRGNRAHKRQKTWGPIRSKVRGRFSKGDYEVRSEWLKPERDCYDTPDIGRMRWKLKNRNMKRSEYNMFWLYVFHFRWKDQKLQHKYGYFIHDSRPFLV